MRHLLTTATVISLLATNLFAHDVPSESRTVSDYVNPFIGASSSTEVAGTYHGLGKTFPGAATPYGMVQLNPNTITGGDNGSGYSYEHTTIEGFAFTQMSGVGWYGDLGNLLVMPTTGPLKTASGKASEPEKGYRSRYDKKSEIAEAGFYSVKLTDFNIKADATVTPHCGILKFTFPENEQSRIQIDLARRVGGTSVRQYIRVENENTIRGWMKCTADGGGWGNGDGKPDYTVYFYGQFSKPLSDYGFWVADIPDDWSRKLGDVTGDRYQQRIAEAKIVRGKQELEGKHIGFFAEYATREGDEIDLKVGISFVDMEGAERNFNAEIAHSGFAKVREDAKQLWNKALGNITVSGGSMDERKVFYTALYHTMIDPRMFSDVDGRYPGADGKVHTADGFTKRTIFSGWDVFRSQFPLQTLINPRLVNDEINSLIALAEESGNGYFERWEFLNAYSGCMIGNPAIAVIADAWCKQIRGYDLEKAYAIALKTSEKFGNGNMGYSSTGLGISETLEYAYSDWCVAQLAKYLGKTDAMKKFSERALAYKNIFDKEKGWFRPRRADGTWDAWPEEGRLREWYGSIESNPYQQGWFVPQDVNGMIELMGGREAVLADLNTFFEKTPQDFLWNQYYNHANEPVHHVPFLFNRLGAPWLTQKWTRIICEKAYRNEVVGLVGNEDVGQMSAWYVLAAIGLHPVCPGDPRYELTSPVFGKMEIRLDPVFAEGKTFTIIAHDNSGENSYIQRAVLNGKPYTKCYINHKEITKGGTLELFMGPNPNKSWGVE